MLAGLRGSVHDGLHLGNETGSQAALEQTAKRWPHMGYAVISSSETSRDCSALISRIGVGLYCRRKQFDKGFGVQWPEYPSRTWR